MWQGVSINTQRQHFGPKGVQHELYTPLIAGTHTLSIDALHTVYTVYIVFIYCSIYTYIHSNRIIRREATVAVRYIHTYTYIYTYIEIRIHTFKIVSVCMYESTTYIAAAHGQVEVLKNILAFPELDINAANAVGLCLSCYHF